MRDSARGIAPVRDHFASLRGGRLAGGVARSREFTVFVGEKPPRSGGSLPIDKPAPNVLLRAAMIDTRRTVVDTQDDARFASFTRDLARRHRRPRSYPPPPSVMADALEQLCGGSSVVVAAAPDLSMPALPDESVTDFEDLVGPS